MRRERAGRSTHARILAVVRRIPAGRVATYGQVAALAGLPRHARLVGYALHALPEESRVPWHRVVNAAGKISLRRGVGPALQRALLEREGVAFGPNVTISLARYAWRPRSTRPRRARKTGPHAP